MSIINSQCLTGFNTPRKGRDGVSLPEVRKISAAIFQSRPARETSPAVTVSNMVFGQFLAHDTAKTAITMNPAGIAGEIDKCHNSCCKQWSTHRPPTPPHPPQKKRKKKKKKKRGLQNLQAKTQTRKTLAIQTHLTCTLYMLQEVIWSLVVVKVWFLSKSLTIGVIPIVCTGYAIYPRLTSTPCTSAHFCSNKKVQTIWNGRSLISPRSE